jgi:hypothetical protein
VTALSWPHNGTLSPQHAAERLAALIFTLESPLHPDLVRAPPPVVQVWVETANAQAAMPILSLAGTVKLDAQTVVWSSGMTADLLAKSLPLGARVLLRLHCGWLFDANKRPYSSTSSALMGIPVPRMPGGVFESWFFVGVESIRSPFTFDATVLRRPIG